MRQKLLSIVLSAGLMAATVSSVAAQGGQTTGATVPLPNCNVNPANTIDPPAVAAAQRAIASFLAEVNREWSAEGYSSSAAMIGAEGNAQSDWYDQTAALACGRLIGGYRGMNWGPARGGWAHDAPPTARTAGGC